MSEDLVHADGGADAQSEKSGWQPISSAPKDGTEIFVVTEYGNLRQARFTNGKWFYTRDIGHHLASSRFTHWMPLPFPPSDGDRTDEKSVKDSA